MKRIGLWVIGIGLVITVGLLTVEPGYAEEEDDAPTCTLKTLKGRYLFGGIATLLDPDDPDPLVKQQLLAVAGFRTFNGDGTGTDIVTASINGVARAGEFRHPHQLYRQPGLFGHLHSPRSRRILRSLHRAQWCGADRYRDDPRLRIGGSE